MQYGRVIYGVNGQRDYALNALSEAVLFRVGDDLDGLIAQSLVPGDGRLSPGDLAALPLVDYELIMAHFYVATFGEVIGQNITCSVCQNRYAFEFSLSTFASLMKQEVDRDEARDFEGGTYSFPTLALMRQSANDRLALARALWNGPGGLDLGMLEAFEAHLAKTCPVMQEELHAPCPNCQSDQRRQFVLRDHLAGRLRSALQVLLGQIHQIAASYHWPATDILALPQRSRMGLVNAIRGDGRTAPRQRAR